MHPEPDVRRTSSENDTAAAETEAGSVKETEADRVAVLTVKVAELTEAVNSLMRHVHGASCQPIQDVPRRGTGQ